MQLYDLTDIQEENKEFIIDSDSNANWLKKAIDKFIKESENVAK